MSGSIRQMQVVYSPEEDRLLFRVNSTDSHEFRFWLTRRYCILLARVLREHRSADPDVSTQVTPAAREAVQAFKQEKAIGQANFKDRFNADGNDFPLGEDIRLAHKLSYSVQENNNLHISVQPKEGQGINMVINQEINISLTRLLAAAAAKGEWRLDDWFVIADAAAKETKVIN